MNRNREIHTRNDGIITAVAFGGFLIIVGLVFAMNSGLWQGITNFFNNITTRSFPVGNTTSNTMLPAPVNPAGHNALYNAVFQFDVAFGILQLLILGLRIWMRSRISRIAETLGNAVFWLGAAGLVNVFLLTGTLNGWFEYWTALIVVVGVSFVARATVYFLKRK